MLNGKESMVECRDVYYELCIYLTILIKVFEVKGDKSNEQVFQCKSASVTF